MKNNIILFRVFVTFLLIANLVISISVMVKINNEEPRNDITGGVFSDQEKDKMYNNFLQQQTDNKK